MSKNLTYKSAGVDTKEGAKAVDQIKNRVKKTFTKNVLTGLGNFSSLYELPKNFKNPVLVSGTDGVGTKLKIAFDLNIHNKVGIDLVAMCVNDILCQGAKPLFFLDYIATDKVKAKKIGEIVEGIVQGCKTAECSLIGGETAEMPGLYKKDEYDLAGFAVGVVEKEKIITGKKIKDGDVIISLSSSGIHSNGFSLVRKVLKSSKDLLIPTKIYVPLVLPLTKKFNIHGIVHITGGGFYENIPRIIPDGLCAEIDFKKLRIPKVFKTIKEKGNIKTTEMLNTFNMGSGMMLIVSKKDADNIVKCLEGIIKKTKDSTKVNIIGEIKKSKYKNNVSKKIKIDGINDNW